MEDSEYESTESGLGESKKRTFPFPTPKGVFMFVGVVMMIGVLGMAGYIFYKGPDSKSHRLVASSETTEVSGERRQNEAEVEDPVPVPATTRKPKPKPPTNKRSKKKRSAPASAAKKKSKTTNKGAKAARKRHATTGRAVEDAPQNAPEELDGDEAEEEPEQGSDDGSASQEGTEEDDSEEEDNKNARRLFKEDPHCMSEREMYQCSDQEQGDMMRSYVCMSSSQETSCLEWRPQRLCLSSESNRFGSEEECQKACQGANEGKCGRAALCECTKFYRKMNYVFDVRRQRCRLVALHECVEAEVGFPDEDSCKAACSNGDTDGRCKLAALEDLVRPCLWRDKLYTHFYDHKNKRCQGWDEDVCTTNGFTRLTECLRNCKGPSVAVRQVLRQLQGNTTLGGLPTSSPPKAAAEHRAA